MKPVMIMVVAAAFAFPALADDMADVRRALSERLPDAAITSLEPTPIPGLFEAVIDGERLFVDKAARFAVVGVFYDLETHNSDPEDDR